MKSPLAGVIMLEPDGHISLMNPAAAQIFGTGESSLRKHYSQVIQNPIVREMLDEANGAIDKMSPRMAAALRLYRVEGLGQRDIAEQLGISVSAVEKLLRKAYAQILTFARTQDSAEPPPRRRHDTEGSY